MRTKSIQYWLQRYDKGDRLRAVCHLIHLDPASVMNVCRSDAKSNRVAWRARAARLMGELGHPASPYIDERISVLGTMLARDDSPTVRRESAWSLAVIARPASYKAMKKFVHDDDPLVRQAIASCLYKIADSSAWSVVKKFARDPDRRVREMAAFSLGVWSPIGTQNPTQILRPLLSDSNRDVRNEAIRATLSQGDLNAVPHLLRELEFLEVPTELVYAVLELAIKAEELAQRGS